MNSLNRKLLRDLIHLRGQVIAVALVAACGIALFVCLRTAHRALVTTQVDYYDSYRFAHVFARVRQAPRSLVRQIESIPGVTAVTDRIVMEVTLDVPGVAEPATGRLVSLPEGPALNRIHLRRGRLPTSADRDEVVVSEALAEANDLEIGSTLGAVIHGRWQRLRLVGVGLSPEYVYEIRGGAEILPDNRHFGVLWMGRGALAAAFQMEGAFNDLALELAPDAREPEVLARLDRLLERYGGLGAYGRADHLSHRFLTDEIAETRVTSTLIPGIFLMVTAFLLHLVLSRLVATQREQIGVLKAFGYPDLTVGLHFVELALVPVVLGAVAGTAVGLWLAAELGEIYARFFRFPTYAAPAAWSVVAVAILVAGGAALLGALAATRRAVVLPPADAMRPPVPAQFQPGPLERHGLGLHLTPHSLFVLRNLERWPGKSLLSVLSIALSVAIVVAGRYTYDAIEFVKTVQFEEVERQDVTVVFQQPLSSAVKHQLTRLPGVVRSEPFRTVAARLVAGPRSDRTAILGLPQGGELRRIVGSDLVPHPVPPAGLVLTAELARRLGVAPGDFLTVEVLEAARPVREVPLAASVDEMLGLAAYMDFAALAHLLGEQGSVSGAHLTVDAQRLDELYRLLKRTPAVGGVAVREATRSAFEATIAESFRISLSIVILFACIIASGMVYNGARTALSERGRELASLRVLGFSRREVAGMLLGEQALLTLAALPIGLTLGLALCTLISLRLGSELIRLPLVVSTSTYLFACLVVMAAAAVSALAVRRRLDHLDLIEVLKTRE